MDPESNATRPAPSQPTVLIVDDHPVFRRLAAIVLQSAGYQVLSASDGEDALAVSRSHVGPIHLLLTDIEMPQLDGFGLRERILAERPGIKIVFMSSTGEAPAELLVRKPFAPRELLDTIQRVMGEGGYGSGRKVLVLEDDRTSRVAIRAILERNGFTVLEATCGAEAAEICAAHRRSISLMVADVVLRVPGGPEILQRIRGLCPQIPILFTSGYPLEELEHRGLIDDQTLSAGAARFLQKPFTAEQLLRSVSALMG